ncbi:MAG TPA: glycosyl hydrolase [Solirubrobacteraceae bacterium]|nr:glycosyl hydrolase [Solirubrobacteraceae bacterium]
MHVDTSHLRNTDEEGRLRRSGRAAVPLILLSLIAALLALRVGVFAPGASSPVWPWSGTVPAATVDLGVTTPPLARNEWRAWRRSDLQSVEAFEQAIHKHASIVMWYADWKHSAPSRAQLLAVAERGSVPEITWEPWDYTAGLYTPQPEYTLQSIIDGAHDAYIREWARALASYGRPVRLRLAQEMNGNWYPWSETANGNHAGQFVAAWRHVHDLFTAAGASNVQWVWSPVALAGTIVAEQYPGSRYVDIVGLSAFNGGAQLKYDRWESFAAKVEGPLRTIEALAPGKPVEISEVGSAEQGGSKAQWITGMFQTLAEHPEIESVIWYDVSTTSDWRIETSRSAERAFAAGAGSARYR